MMKEENSSFTRRREEEYEQDRVDLLPPRETENPSFPLEEKLAIFDKRCDEAAAMIVDLLSWEAGVFIKQARERHIEGNRLYGDRNLFEWDDPTLYGNFIEEIADAIVYLSHWIDRQSKR